MFYTPGSSFQHFGSLPIAETTNSNTIATAEKFVITYDNTTNERPESQCHTSSPQLSSYDQNSLSNQYSDVASTVVSHYPSRSQAQKSSRTRATSM